MYLISLREWGRSLKLATRIESSSNKITSNLLKGYAIRALGRTLVMNVDMMEQFSVEYCSGLDKVTETRNSEEEMRTSARGYGDQECVG